MKKLASLLVVFCIAAACVILMVAIRAHLALPPTPPIVQSAPFGTIANDERSPFLDRQRSIDLRTINSGETRGAEVSADSANDDRIPAEYVLSFYDRRDQERFVDLAEKMGAQVLGQLNVGYMVRIRIGSGLKLDELLRQGPTPLASSANHRVQIPVSLPDTALKEAGGNYVAFGKAAPKWLGADAAREEWGNGVTIAVLDTGVDRGAGLDESNLTRISMLPTDRADYDPVGHGTAVASLLLGCGEDVEGLVPAVNVLSIQVLGPDGAGDAFTLARGIVEAVNRGAEVINLSLGTRGDNIAVSEAIKYALQQGVLVVAATGNDAMARVSYPARYEGVIAVGAVDAARQHAYFSNRGDEVDLVAPGVGVLAAGQNMNAGLFSGTSSAAPFVSGAIAMLLSSESAPGAEDIPAVLAANSDDEGVAGRDIEYGDGILNLKRLLEHEEDGVHDAAVMAPYIVDASEDGKDVVLRVGFQNRGTEILARAVLSATVENRPYSREFTNVLPGCSHGFEVSLSGATLSGGQISIACSVSTPGAKDARPSNNSNRIVLMGNRAE